MSDDNTWKTFSLLSFVYPEPSKLNRKPSKYWCLWFLGLHKYQYFEGFCLIVLDSVCINDNKLKVLLIFLYSKNQKYQYFEGFWLIVLDSVCINDNKLKVLLVFCKKSMKNLQFIVIYTYRTKHNQAKTFSLLVFLILWI